MAALPYRPAIDGLRAIAVLAVFVFHLNHSWLPGGFVGVDVFFVISGYLITSIILKDCETGHFSLARFYQRRIARIYPAFFAVGLVTLIGASQIYSPQDFASAGATFSASALSVANMKFMLQGNYFEISPDAQPFLHCWSLSVEEQFYLLFPLFFLLLFKFARKRQALVLGVLALASLLACIAMTQWRPVWAFYLLPTRGWELLVGCILAVAMAQGTPTFFRRGASWLHFAGLCLIATSLIFLHEDRSFPGWRALLPTLGAAALLVPATSSAGLIEKLLSVRPLTVIGRMSYSLYLWHWPVFSLVDYQMILAPEWLRLALKIGLSFAAAAISFKFIETPARILLNRPKARTTAYASLAAALAICIPLGISIRKANYINATPSDVANGGLVFPGKPGAPSVMLMGDSNGSMYGKGMKDICENLGEKLTVISMAAGDPLPSSDGHHGKLWLDSLAAVKKERPDCLILVCHWSGKLAGDPGRLAMALDLLRPHVGRIVLFNQPPTLPRQANRIDIRNGVRSPFFEEPNTRASRKKANEFLLQFQSDHVTIVDVAARFENQDGSVLFSDDRGRQLYNDGSHLSSYGVDLLRTKIEPAITTPQKAKRDSLNSVKK